MIRTGCAGALLAGFLGLALDGSAQELSISGTVKDPQAVALGISVTLRDPAGTTPVDGKQSEVSKQAESEQKPAEGDNHSYSTVSPATLSILSSAPAAF